MKEKRLNSFKILGACYQTDFQKYFSTFTNFYYLLSPGSQKHETKHLYYVEVSPIEILTEL